MKNLPKLGGISGHLFIVVVLAGLVFSGCDPIDTTPVVDVDINPAFRLDPPVPDAIFLEKLPKSSKQGNFLMTLEFNKEERPQIGEKPFFATLRGDEKVVFRDDGKGGDKVAGDNIFSLIVNEDEQEILAQMKKANEVIDKSEKNVFSTFRMREKIDREITKFELSEFEVGRRIRLDDILATFSFIDPDLKDHSLMITDVNVVEDTSRTVIDPCNPQVGEDNKAWSFGRLMKELANESVTGISASTLALSWLETWTNDQIVNGFTIPERDAIESMIIDPWKFKSDFATTGKLDMRFAPFKLIAIVNRLDLREGIGYGGTNAGEGRFVFCALDDRCVPMTRFTVIFEYGVNISGCANVKAYAQKWYDLKDLAFSDPNYNNQLQMITDVFTLANTNPRNPNRSSLNQLRTNENELVIDWELREFRIGASRLLEPVTVKQEPAEQYNNVSPLSNSADVKIMAQWANTNEAVIMANAHIIPEIEPASTQPFLGARSLPGTNVNYHWDGEATGAGRITRDQVRHIVSLNTCGGCHAGETGTSFLHVAPPSSFGSPATLSGFLTGITVPDPARSGAPSHSFDDLQNRAQKLEDLVNTNCKSIFGFAARLRFERIKMVH